MNELSLETLYALNDVANVTVEINDGRITAMNIEGGLDNE